LRGLDIWIHEDTEATRKSNMQPDAPMVLPILKENEAPEITVNKLPFFD
jgi:hypothetical protein